MFDTALLFCVFYDRMWCFGVVIYI